MKPTLLCALVVLLALPARAEERHLGTPAISPTARALIQQKMRKHSRQMTELTWAVVLLDYARSTEIALALATEPTTSATVLGAALPPRFFALQEQLRGRAREIHAAARGKNAQTLATAYGGLAETCVSCHDAYMSAR